jgi:hypothetical protein
MRFRLGLVAGFAVGYYLGAKAGRERYEQLREWAGRVGDTQPFEKARAALELALERIRPEQPEASVMFVEEVDITTSSN